MLGAVALDALAATLRTSRGVAAKRDIAAVGGAARRVGRSAVPVGDDCAAIPDGDGYLLLAIEGFMNEFVAGDPWFAGWCGVMVNVSDVAAMGGRPIAVVDAVWAAGQATPSRCWPACARRRGPSACRWSAGTPTPAPIAASSRSRSSAAPSGC